MKAVFQMRLKELRETAGYSQYTFAKAFGVAQSTVGSWESGAKEPRNYAATRRLADFFNVTTDYLLGCTDDPTPHGEKDDGINIGTLEYALLNEVRELDDEGKEELLRNARRLRELIDLRKKIKEKE